MVARGEGGVIVNITSTAAYRAEAPGAAHYVASKFGVRGLTQALAVELGPHGIRVLAVAPTVTLTPGLETQRGALQSAGFLLDDLGPQLPLGRVAVPDDVARVVLFCASDLSLLMTGSTLLVDAGELVERVFASLVAIGVGEDVDADVAGRDARRCGRPRPARSTSRRARRPSSRRRS